MSKKSYIQYVRSKPALLEFLTKVSWDTNYIPNSQISPTSYSSSNASHCNSFGVVGSLIERRSQKLNFLITTKRKIEKLYRKFVAAEFCQNWLDLILPEAFYARQSCVDICSMAHAFLSRHSQVILLSPETTLIVLILRWRAIGHICHCFSYLW